MNLRVGVSLIVGLSLLSLTAGCGSTAESSPSQSASASKSASTSVSPSGGNVAPGDECLVGAWNVDMNDLALHVPRLIQGGTTATASGSIGFVFNAATVKANYAAVVTIEQALDRKPTASVVAKTTGLAEARYAANGTTMLLSGGRNQIKTTQAVTVNGKTTAPNIPFDLEALTDFTSDTVAYSCSSDLLRLANRSGFAVTANRAA